MQNKINRLTEMTYGIETKIIEFDYLIMYWMFDFKSTFSFLLTFLNKEQIFRYNLVTINILIIQ